ncbi:arylsulfatase [Thalassoglobus polymorphus]|uniref:Arylsulfatase n=1 Tax=Thalassoglobus polymorphus TaxID=2527994 RepID=A0A517QM42_9PLAN|nr:Arylsulfatase [Thalassoglobus polymorphus]
MYPAFKKRTRLANTQVGFRRSFPRDLLHRITTLAFLLATTILPQLIFPPTLRAVQPQRPNIVLILTDDQGWGDLSLNGNTNLQTPNIDSLARDGAQFDRFFVCPVCSPTRAELLTGRYHPRCGVYSTSAGGERINLDEMTIGQTYQAAGYKTAAYGKWHNGMQAPYHPNSRGFDDYYGFCSGHWGQYFDWMMEHNGELVQGNGFCIDDFTNHAMRFMEEHQKEPFFVYLPYNTPHSPMQVPGEYWNRFKEKELLLRDVDPDKENLGHTRAALAMCENIDWNVGRILEKLESLELAENTIVVYFCDNGPNGRRWNGEMKGRKGSTDEGGVRSPLLIRWPNHIPAGKTVTEISGVIDLLPTLAELSEIPVASQKPLDGMSLKIPLTQENYAWPDRTIFSQWRGRVSARTQQYRLDHQGKLYDMLNDPSQSRDVSSEHPEQARVLREAVSRWKSEVLAGYDDDKRPFVIGHADSSNTQLPARDGVPHGNIKRSNKYPNASYFTNWTSLDDKITWEVELPEDGTFDVELYYTCKKDDIGCTIQLSDGHAQLETMIQDPHDPPIVGADEDRVRRAESYVKQFQPHNMGQIKMKKGRKTLSLRATKIPGDQAIEFRLLMLKRRNSN